VEPKKPPFDSVEFWPDGKTLTLFGGSSNWVLNLDNYAASVAASKNSEDGNRLSAGRTDSPIPEFDRRDHHSIRQSSESGCGSVLGG
jgi:hypothetical protein